MKAYGKTPLEIHFTYLGDMEFTAFLRHVAQSLLYFTQNSV
jgi:hypothetical protein